MRCRRGCVVKCIVCAACVTSILFWWRVYLFSDTTDADSHDVAKVILTKQNAPFLNVGRRFNPKILGKRDHVEEARYNNSQTKYAPLQPGNAPMPGKPTGANIGDYDVNYNVHAFYYAWYGNPGQDGKYFHWDHKYLPHWNSDISAKYPTGQAHLPPDDIGSSFYPLMGPYSSLDESITRSHMMQMQQAGIGVLALSWYPPGMADDQGKPIESYVPTIFDIADQYSIKVCFHIEPYAARTAASVRESLKYIIKKYGSHPAFYRYRKDDGKELPLVYVYDSYMIQNKEWQGLLTTSGHITIRETELDAIVIGLVVERKHLRSLLSSGFDGMYTYFAANGFSYGSTWGNWNEIAAAAKQQKLIFIPSVGPGYDDLRVRPWNGANVHLRNNGSYYERSWKMATSTSHASIVSITSFNEWHEGTQIEPASSALKHGRFTYQTYDPFGPNYYLDITKKWTSKFHELNSKR